LLHQRRFPAQMGRTNTTSVCISADTSAPTDYLRETARLPRTLSASAKVSYQPVRRLHGQLGRYTASSLSPSLLSPARPLTAAQHHPPTHVDYRTYIRYAMAGGSMKTMAIMECGGAPLCQGDAHCATWAHLLLHPVPHHSSTCAWPEQIETTTSSARRAELCINHFVRLILGV